MTHQAASRPGSGMPSKALGRAIPYYRVIIHLDDRIIHVEDQIIHV